MDVFRPETRTLVPASAYSCLTSPTEHEAVCGLVAARFESRWLRSYVRSKLRTDPVYAAVYDLLRPSPLPLLDVGCGIGLLGFYLRARALTNSITGLDSDRRKIARANALVSDGLTFLHRDALDGISFAGNVALLDVLHYLSPVNQQLLLQVLADRVAPGGLLLIRDAPRDNSYRFRLTYLAEKFAQMTSWSRWRPMYFPFRTEIVRTVEARGLTGTVVPLWGNTPFNNHLFCFRKSSTAAAPALGARNGSPHA